MQALAHAELLLGSTFALGILTLVICLFGGPISVALGLVDPPDNDRKQHEAPTPMVGGIAVLAPVVLWCASLAAFMLTSPDTLPSAVAISAGGAGLVGLTDDQSNTSPESRIVLLLILAIAALQIDPHLIASQVNWGLTQSTALPVYLAWGLATVSLIGLASAVNMVDGIHGLALALYLVWSICLTISTGGTVQMLALAASVTVLVTLLFNFRGGIFIGDCGTYGITFLIGLLAIRAHNSGEVPILSIGVWFCLPVLDCFRLIIQRTTSNRAPWRGDNNHLHHRMMRRFGPTRALFYYVSVVAVSSLAVTVWPSLAILALVGLSLFYAMMMSMTVGGIRSSAQLPAAQWPGNVVILDSDSEKSRTKGR
jgi:UDP-GlcNAc:undecaprenyl-phosphate GlcNAc-1-phosphate transferase